MGLLRRKADSDGMQAASGIVTNFYSKSNNSDGALLEAADRLEKLSLSRKQLSDIRMLLPVKASGTNGEKVARIDRVLKRLEKELV